MNRRLRHTVVLASVSFALVITGIIWGLHFHGPEHFFGIDTQASPNYDFVSGFGPILATLVGWTGLICSFVYHRNCHVRKCWGLGRFPMAGGQLVVCKFHSHHPDEITHEYALSQHRKYLELLDSSKPQTLRLAHDSTKDQ